MYITAYTPGKYTRIPMNCEKCHTEHQVSIFHIGPDPNADCGKCIADETFRNVKIPDLKNK